MQGGEEAVALHEAGHLSAAAAQYEALLAAEPGDVEVLWLLGMLRWQEGSLDTARALLERALDRAPEDASVQALLGTIHFSDGRAHDAVSCWQRSLALDPEQPQTWSNLGLALQARGELAGAVEAHRTALSWADAAGAEAGALHYNLGLALQAQGDRAGAEAAYRQALLALPGDAEVLNNLGNLLREQGAHAEAAGCYRAALRTAPDLAHLHHNLGAACRALGDAAGARAALERATALAPGHIDAWILLGIVLGEAQRLEEAAEAFRTALALDPASLMAWIHLGHTFRGMGREGAALVAYQSAVRHTPDSADAYVNLGVAHHNRGELAEAMRCYQQALALHPDEGTARHLLDALRGQTPATAPASYITDLFDQYAETYDHHLQETLRYRSPAALRELLDEVAPPPMRRFARAIDLGCGTGLGAPALRERVDHLTGVDLSPRMLQKARERGLYDDLRQQEILSFLLDLAAVGVGVGVELVMAADVLVYVGDLGPLLGALSAVMAPGGLVLLSTERADGEGYLLRETGRFAHSRAHVEGAAVAAGFGVLRCASAAIRCDGGRWVEGDLFVLAREGG